MSEHVMRIALIGTILEAGKADSVARICSEYGAFYHISLPVKGMARSELLDVLGLGEKNWALTLSLVPQPLVHYLRRTLRDALMLVQPNMGILFTVPLSGINARAAAAISKGTNSEYLEESMVYERGEKPMAESIIYDLIVAITNLNHSESVMSAARSAGASGGTLLHTHVLGEEKDAAKFLGITLQEEKEVVMILARHDMKTGIMQAIMDDCGPDTPAETMVLALPVDGIAGLR